ncbi:cupin domain-containing protein [Marinobacterium sediminicola]|uniref:Cupin domain-containing protein n=1 Tax=Marinobacterium sediminicola TaxID=518898 RepID=A0ABY1S4A7_9GAMM|nr:cupin domain-containing protein [Marinobacterium sediminicola]ULG70152.1 cupin domain-containing protein [Marinobacterium sediminicola]SMR78378.1 Cupin domain-containing protein [Marinobacterium sediminicola]
MRITHYCVAVCAGLIGSAPLMANDETPPEKAMGISGGAEAVGLVDLAPHELPGSVGDYDLRARLVGIAPGGAIHNHPHHGRPGIVRVTKGTVIEYRGESSRTLQVGDAWYENADTVHWFRNPSETEDAEIWVVDLVPKAQ